MKHFVSPESQSHRRRVNLHHALAFFILLQVSITLPDVTIDDQLDGSIKSMTASGAFHFFSSKTVIYIWFGL